MPKQEKRTKQIAQRIDPGYYKKPHPMRRWRFLLTAVLCLIAAGWVGASVLTGQRGAYTNGPISPGHALFEMDCALCHTEAFGPVYDSSCIACHTAGSHVGLHRTWPGIDRDPSCATCHAEHRGQDGLVQVADSHCNRCHEAHHNIVDFERHPQFRNPAREQHLRFNHKLHMDPNLVDGPLDCSSCHAADGTKDFAPIAFDQHCAECHSERMSGGESVPHGLQREELRDFIRAALLRTMDEKGELRESASIVPGRGATEFPAWSTALDERTNRALAALLPKDAKGKARGCLVCHSMEDDAIVKPDVPSRWLDKARFDHRTHRFESCSKCHDMSENTKSGTLQLPGVVSCRECHKEGGARTTCATCHTYHPTSDPAAWR